jgi:hypothetical protein
MLVQDVITNQLFSFSREIKPFPDFFSRNQQDNTQNESIFL